MVQKSKSQRQARRRLWYDQERPTLLVRLRLIATPEQVDMWKDTTWLRRDQLRAHVSWMERKQEN